MDSGGYNERTTGLFELELSTKQFGLRGSCGQPSEHSQQYKLKTQQAFLGLSLQSLFTTTCTYVYKGKIQKVQLHLVCVQT